MKLSEKTLVSPIAEYQVGGQLGEGGAGIVYSATRHDGTTVAIKVLKPIAVNRENNNPTL